MLYSYLETRSILCSYKNQISLKTNLAAAIDHRSLTSFIVACAKEQAERLIERETTIRLKKREWDQFISALENSPKPNVSLKKLMRETAE